MSDDDLRSLLDQSHKMLRNLAQSLDRRSDLMEVVQGLIVAADMNHAFEQLEATNPDMMPLVLQASVSALINVYSAECLKDEIKRRAADQN